jgi:hypothetical protein
MHPSMPLIASMSVLLISLAGCATPPDHEAHDRAKAMDCKKKMGQMHATHHAAPAPAGSASASAGAMQCSMEKKG